MSQQFRELDEPSTATQAEGAGASAPPELGTFWDGATPPTSSPRRLPGLAGRYAPYDRRLDEFVEPDGALRPHWHALVAMLDDLGPTEIAQRWDRARRLIRDNGITFNVYGDPAGLARPWSLDLLPLLLPEAEFDGVSAALAQRARLLDALLADVYGPATALRAGLLPAELVYTSPWFLRAVHGVTPPRNKWLHLYAADLVRTGNGGVGGFEVLADRTQAPSGAGYCLENRIVLTRTLPTVFRECHVRRLAPFFIALRESLASLAPANRENPRVVLLTPGPYNETYFEHAYLARYLNYTLVQGKDLTVRDGRVYLKTLGALQRVDVILRRVDDSFCDPLELYGRSFLGVPGLLQAVRDGTVAVANMLGAGFAQSPALFPYLPALARHFLGEDLLLPSVRTWWCGDDDSRRFVLDNLRELVIKPAFPGPNTDPVFGAELSAPELERLADAIRTRPGDYVAQARVESSCTPVLTPNGEDGPGVQSRRFVLRSFLTEHRASAGGYATLPGGLTRVTASTDGLIVSLQRGGGSKDTWVPSSVPVAEVSLLSPPSAPVELSRGGGELPSRVADDLFWLGRYVARAEAAVRLARTCLARIQDSPDGPEPLRPMLVELLSSGGANPDPESLPRDVDAAARLVISPSDPTGLRASLAAVRILARALRDRISTDAFRVLQSTDALVTGLDGARRDPQDDVVVHALDVLDRMVTGFLAFGGVVADAMTRGQGWRFLEVGLRLERGVGMARLCRAAAASESPHEAVLLETLLEVADSSLTYRRRYLTQLQAPAVLDLLLADESNPRSTAFHVAAIEAHLAQLPHDPTHPQRSPDLAVVSKVRALLRFTDLRAACAAEPPPTRRALYEMTTTVFESLSMLSDLINQTYFSHAAPSKPVAGDALDQGGQL